jgi:hypothetical protein
MNSKMRKYNLGLLVISIVFYSRLEGIENIRTLQFLWIWLIGAFSGPIIFDFIHWIKSKFKSKA